MTNNETRRAIVEEKHLTTSVILLSRELPRRVLLMYHEKSNKWVPPGGHLEIGENSIDAGVREVFEETGIDIRDAMPKPTRLNGDTVALPLPQYFFEEHIAATSALPAHYHVDLVYVVFIPFQPPHPHSKKPYQTRWFAIDEIQNIPLFDNIKQIVKSLR